jgi:PAS domain S-box-containing protein
MIETGTSTILIVDDQAGVRAVLKGMLLEEGYKLIFAENGPEALDKVVDHWPDLILLDVMMPGMTGIEVCQHLRAQPQFADISVIMITALDDPAIMLEGLEAGANDFISKPFNSSELKARVRTMTRFNSQRRLLTQQLRAERDRTTAILEALGEAVVVCDMAGHIRHLNPAAVDQLGFTLEEVEGRHWRLLQHQPEQVAIYDQILALVRAGEIWRGEIVYQRKDGTHFDAALTIAPLVEHSNHRQPSGFVCVQRDITPLKEAEQSKAKFLSNVTHELSTPLSVINLLSDNLETLYTRLTDDKRRKMARDIQKNTKILDELIHDVLDISRLDSGRISTKREPLNLAQLICEEVNKLLPLAEQKSQQLRLIGLDNIDVWGNDGQLRQVIRNLLSNAIKYTPVEGQIVCERQIITHSVNADPPWPGQDQLVSGCWAALRVADTGMGISYTDLPRVFERFYRVETQSNIRGTGLGLSIAQELVELHGGVIAVSSELDKGSSFAVYLPLLNRQINPD